MTSQQSQTLQRLESLLYEMVAQPINLNVQVSPNERTAILLSEVFAQCLYLGPEFIGTTPLPALVYGCFQATEPVKLQLVLSEERAAFTQMNSPQSTVTLYNNNTPVLELALSILCTVIMQNQRNRQRSIQRPKREYVLAKAETVDLDWECSICLGESREGLAYHPVNCHIFHEKCLKHAMIRNIRCPLCRRFVTPLLVRNIG